MYEVCRVGRSGERKFATPFLFESLGGERKFVTPFSFGRVPIWSRGER
jgi:hypothetical protein